MFSGRHQKLYEKKTLETEYPLELTLKLTEDGPAKSFQNTRFSNHFRPFSTLFDLFRTFSGVFGLLGDQGGWDRKVHAKTIPDIRKIMIKMPENRPSKFRFFGKFGGKIFWHFHNVFPKIFRMSGIVFA